VKNSTLKNRTFVFLYIPCKTAGFISESTRQISMKAGAQEGWGQKGLH